MTRPGPSPPSAIGGGTSRGLLERATPCLRMGLGVGPPSPGHPVKRGRRATLQTGVPENR